MKNTGNIEVTTPTEREIVMTRVFDAPRSLVFSDRPAGRCRSARSI
ncbi:MAG: hypothetical protein USCGTAYLOR_02594 [Chromatiales bacterium USCg_Taylor]|nr:MAG: hypothetical protein USCGTAYLOR_02594 [Chromatiales bacterium USCg_Taylor]